MTAGTPIISIILPTLNAEGQIGHLVDVLCDQTVKPSEILIIDSSSNDNTVQEAKRSRVVRADVIQRSEFDHGGTRHKAFTMTSGEYVLFITQDAIPATDRYIENLIAPFADEQVAMSSGKQLPKPDARRYEQLVREFNYPKFSNVRSIEDEKRYGIKAFYVSDVCSAYRRQPYLDCGGFLRPCSMSEDMYMAATLAHAGYKIAYAANAGIYHSHNLTFAQQYKRNYAIGAFLERNSKLLGNASELGEGKKLASQVVKTLLSERNIREIIAFGSDCTARFFGNRLGRSAVKKGKE